MERGKLLLGYADISQLSAADVMRRLGEISPYRQKKILANKTDKGIRQSFGAGLLLETMLIQCGAVPDFYSGEHGKPYVSGNIFFNVSHSRDMIFCALFGSEVGCDAEIITEIRPRVLDNAFSFEEKEYIAGDDEKFYSLWTIKESYVKYLGQTVALVKSAEVEITANNTFKIKSSDVDIITGEINKYKYSVCGKGILSVELKNYNILFA